MRVDREPVRHVGVPDPVGHDLRVYPGIERGRGVSAPLMRNFA
jgi:hypothetical protein